MFNSFEIIIALRYLISRRKEGFISVIAIFSFLGIMLGVATLIVVMSVMNGFRTELLDRILGINSHASIVSYGRGIEGYDEIAEKVRNIEGVSNAAPVLNGQVLAVANGANSGIIVRGIKKEDLSRKKLIVDNIKLGSTEEFSGYSVIIGSRVASAMNISVGDEIRLISPQTTQTFIGAMPRLKDFKVVGIFEVGMTEYDSSTIFMPLDTAQVYFKYQNMVTAIEVYAENPREMEQLLTRIDNATGGEFNIIDWKQANSHFINALVVERNVMFLILTLIIIVAVFNVISGMVMLVNSKKREISILRTMGAAKGSIMRIFFICGSAIGVLGTFFGFLLGLGFASNIEAIRRWLETLTDTELFSAEIYYLSRLPAEVHMEDVVIVVIIALILSFMATLYPAWRAAKVNPAEGVRYE